MHEEHPEILKSMNLTEDDDGNAQVRKSKTLTNFFRPAKAKCRKKGHTTRPGIKRGDSQDLQPLKGVTNQTQGSQKRRKTTQTKTGRFPTKSKLPVSSSRSYAVNNPLHLEYNSRVTKKIEQMQRDYGHYLSIGSRKHSRNSHKREKQ